MGPGHTHIIFKYNIFNKFVVNAISKIGSYAYM